MLILIIGTEELELEVTQSAHVVHQICIKMTVKIRALHVHNGLALSSASTVVCLARPYLVGKPDDIFAHEVHHIMEETIELIQLTNYMRSFILLYN